MALMAALQVLTSGIVYCGCWSSVLTTLALYVEPNPIVNKLSTSRQPTLSASMMPMLEKPMQDISRVGSRTKERGRVSLGTYATVCTTKTLCDINQCNRPDKIINVTEYL